jgi:AcrR family transcriptional regulator
MTVLCNVSTARQNEQMSPRLADPDVRSALIDAAARLLAEHEPLTIRRLAGEVGTSTMAVYTHFGGMDELLAEVRREGFRRLAAHLEAVPPTTDPVADLLSLGWAYCTNAVTNPDLYRVMFLETTVDLEEAAFGAATFLPVVAGVERCVEAGRLEVASAWDTAVQLWGLTHGMVTLALGGMVTVGELLDHLQATIRACLVGYGDSPADVDTPARGAHRPVDVRRARARPRSTVRA